MILEKHFKFYEDSRCRALNISDVEEYVRKKMIHFQNYNNWSSKREHISLFQEILDMVNEDERYIDIDTSDIYEILYSDKFDKRKFIMYYDLVFILGSIAYNVFDYEKNALKKTEDGQHGAINLASMITYGYEELASAKKEQKNASYGATLVFTTVLETELKRKAKHMLQCELANAVEKKIQLGSFVTSSEDSNLLDCLQGRKEKYDPVYATTFAADNLFARAEVYDAQFESEQKSLILNKTTLNQLLQSNFIGQKAEPVFLEIMKLLFGTGNLNLRNDIAHGGFGYQNYYHTSASALLYLLLVNVIRDYWAQ